MKKRIVALACGVCLLSLLPSCPFRIPTVAKAGQNHIAGAQPSAVQAVAVHPKASGL